MTDFSMVFLDTSFIIAFYNKKDKNYKEARKIIKKSMEKNNQTIFIYSDYIFDELITLLKAKHIDTNKIHQIGNLLLESKVLKIYFMDDDSFRQTWNLLKDYQDKEWSFTDASSFTLMENLNITYYLSFDRHFAQYPKIQKWQP